MKDLGALSANILPAGLRESLRRREGRIVGTREVKDTTRKLTESTNPQGLTETDTPT